MRGELHGAGAGGQEGHEREDADFRAHLQADRQADVKGRGDVAALDPVADVLVPRRRKRAERSELVSRG